MTDKEILLAQLERDWRTLDKPWVAGCRLDGVTLVWEMRACMDAVLECRARGKMPSKGLLDAALFAHFREPKSRRPGRPRKTSEAAIIGLAVKRLCDEHGLSARQAHKAVALKVGLSERAVRNVWRKCALYSDLLA